MEHTGSRRVLIALDLFAGLCALAGMVMLLTGWPYQFPLENLAPTPFADYLVPGLLLGLVVGGSAFVAAWETFRSPAAGALASLVAGVIMMGWIIGEYILVPAVRVTASEPASWQQPLMFVVGLAMVLLALRVAPGGWRRMATLA